MTEYCTKCGHRVIRDAGGYMHHPETPLSAKERASIRHKPVVLKP